MRRAKSLVLPLFLLLAVPVHARIDMGRVQECKGKPTAEETLNCFTRSAKEDNTLQYCAYFNDWQSTKICIERRNKVRRVSPKECAALGKFTEQCTDYVRSGVAEPAPEKITVEDCKAIGPGYEDYDYCFMDLAQQEKSVQYCDAMNTWSGVKECIYYVDRERKITEGDCTWLSQYVEECKQYVRGGIPSKPGVAFEYSESS